MLPALLLEAAHCHVPFIHANHVAAFAVFRDIHIPMDLRARIEDRIERHGAAAVRIHSVGTLQLLPRDLSAPAGRLLAEEGAFSV